MRTTKADIMIEEYRKAVNGLSLDDRHSFLNYFIGSLSVDVSRKAWMKSLQIATHCLKEYSNAVDEVL